MKQLMSAKDDRLAAVQESETSCAGGQEDTRLAPEFSAAVCDCLQAYWVALGFSPERAAALSAASLRIIWEHRDVEGTWVLLPPE